MREMEPTAVPVSTEPWPPLVTSSRTPRPPREHAPVGTSETRDRTQDEGIAAALLPARLELALLRFCALHESLSLEPLVIA